jgi:hypothetical protein
MANGIDASSTIKDFVHQHQLSSKRDAADAADDVTYPSVDKTAAKLFESTQELDNKILTFAKAGKPIPASLLKSALSLHRQCTQDDHRDLQGDYPAVTKDQSDMKKEQLVINSDNALLKLPNLSLNLTTAIKDDIRSKQLLIAGEKQDKANENAYIGHDLADIKATDRVNAALNGNRGDLVAALEADLKTKSMQAHDRREDAQLEPGYANADVRDQTVNKFLLDMLQQDPYTRKYFGEVHQNHTTPTQAQSGPPESPRS